MSTFAKRMQVFRFSTSSDTNRTVQPQKKARGLKFQIEEVEGLYYLCSENTGCFGIVFKNLGNNGASL